MDNMTMLIRWLQSHRATMLLILTILLLLALSITERYRYGVIAIAPVVLLVIVAAARVASQYRRIFRSIIIPLAIAWLVARVSVAVGAPSGEAQIAWVLGLALTAGLLAVLLRGLAEARNVTTETISQAFSGYLLIAIAFAQFYGILNNFIPGAFNPAAPTGGISLFIYFSFSTITSVGFGDVTPLDPFVRIVAAMEATTGIFYQTVVIARLVSLYIPRHPLQSPEPAGRPEGKPMPSGGN